MKILLEGTLAGLTKSYEVFYNVFDFPFVRPYKVFFLRYFHPKGLMKCYFLLRKKTTFQYQENSRGLPTLGQ